jgi:hypothetical protein
VHETDLSKWYGAEKRAADVQPFSSLMGAWKRYLQDHTTKAKQEQIGHDIGRHWGVIGRKKFMELIPEEYREMTWAQYSAFLRSYQRMITPYIRCDTAFFGRRRGYASKRGRSGRCITFSRPETLSRLARWAIELHPEETLPDPKTI